MAEFCGSDLCGARMQMFLLDRQDPGLRPPCPSCLDALAEVWKFEKDDWARVMRSVDCHIVGPL